MDSPDDRMQTGAVSLPVPVACPAEPRVSGEVSYETVRVTESHPAQ